MTIEVIKGFEKQIDLLLEYRSDVFQLASGSPIERSKSHFLAEAIFFRMFREYERFKSTMFLRFACEWPTPSGKPVASRLKTDSIEGAEALIKSGMQFLEWSRPEKIRERSKTYLNNGYPVFDLISMFNGDLTNIYRIRNFIAHDSKEAEDGFQKVLNTMLNTPPLGKVSAGEFLVMRGGKSNNYFLTHFLMKMKSMAQAASSL